MHKLVHGGIPMTNETRTKTSPRAAGRTSQVRTGTVSGRLAPEKIQPLHLLWFLIPPTFAILLSFLLKQDQGSFLSWWFTLLTFGIASFPLTCRLFSNFCGKCYGFSKAIGILSASFVLWTLCYLGVIGFTRLWISIFLALLAAVSWGLPSTRKAAVSALSSDADIREIAFQETFFVCALLIMCALKGIRPEINGEEKFMDFAFLNSLVRTDTLPAPDPWLAGYSINYYYYGQYIYAFITKITGITTGVAYNLSMCTTFAFSFTMAYTLGSMFFDSLIRKGMQAPRAFRVGCGILSAFAVSVFGNSHAFFYDENSIGNSFLKFLRAHGVEVGRIDNFFYPDSTRFIGHNPDTLILDKATNAVIKLGDYTIHEFPYYSYLLGDLHAHVVGLLIVMLIIGVLFSLHDKARPPAGEELQVRSFPVFSEMNMLPRRFLYEIKHLLQPEVVIVGVLLGIATMCNYWDFLIYFIAGSMVLLICNIITSHHFASLAGVPFFLFEVFLILSVYLKYSKSAYALVFMEAAVFAVCLIGVTFLPNALTRTGAGMSFLFASASLCSLTFNSHFDMIANSLAKAVDRSPVYQFLILWGVHLFFAVLLLFITIFSRKEFFNRGKPQLKFEKMPRGNFKKSASEDNSSMEPHLPANRIARFFATRWPSDIFMSGIAVVSFLLLAAPEIFYVRDIYGGSYKRANTMFKFAFEAFVLLSLVMAYTFFRFLVIRRKTSLRSAAVIFTAIILSLLLCIPMHYPSASTKQRYGTLDIKFYKGLDGTTDLATRDSPQIALAGADLAEYAAGIHWLNANVKGNPVICEVNGYSYTDNNVVSAYTGLPTILGWQTHEWLWHFQGIVDKTGNLVSDPKKPDVWADIMTPRQNDIKNIYTSNDESAVRWLLQKYNVTYLIVGNLERTQFPDINDTFMQSLGTVVFQEGTFYIIKVQ